MLAVAGWVSGILARSLEDPGLQASWNGIRASVSWTRRDGGSDNAGGGDWGARWTGSNGSRGASG
jgi:hypothetical protein